MKIKVPLSQLLIISIALIIANSVTAQTPNDIVKKLPCPEGPASTLDTVFYTPTTPMPFDECFVLKIIWKGSGTIRFFAVNPVDRYGKIHRTKRDYRLYLRSHEPNRAKWDSYKRAYPFEDFVTGPATSLYPFIKSFSKGSYSEVYLHVPPLDPNRAYQIVLFSNDDSSIRTLTALGSYIFKTVSFPPTIDQLSVVDSKLNALEQNNSKRTIFSNAITAETATDLLAHDTIAIPKNYSPRSETILNKLHLLDLKPDFNADENYQYRRVYRLYFKKATSGTSLDIVNAARVDKFRYIEKISDSNPVLIPLRDNKGQADKLLDIEGADVDFHKSSTYELYALCTEEVYDRIAKQPIEARAISFTDLGLLEIINDGKEAKFTVNKNAIGADDIKLRTNIIRVYKGLDDLKTLIEAKVTYQLADSLKYRAIMAEAINCPCSDKGIKDMTQSNDLFHIIGVMNIANLQQLNWLRTGALSSKDILAETLKAEDFSGKQANIKYSLAQLQLFAEFLRNLRAHDPTNASFSEVYNLVKSLLKDMHEANSKLDKTVKDNALIASVWRNKYQGLEAQSNVVSTNLLDFMSTNKLRIIPDFGLMGVFTGDRVFHVSDLAPYLGFEVDFRSINKNIPMSLVYNKSVWYYLSFSAGLTLTSLAIPNKRTDLFGNQNIYTGLGFRLNNSLRITAGTVWFKTVNTDPLQTNQPLGFSPYVGLSLDLDLQSLFGGISKLFK